MTGSTGDPTNGDDTARTLYVIALIALLFHYPHHHRVKVGSPDFREPCCVRVVMTCPSVQTDDLIQKSKMTA